MKKIMTIGLTVLILVVFNILVIQKENTLKSGKRVLLELAPVDPRSLMQGDYMALRYQIAIGDADAAIKKHEGKGEIVISLDHHVGSFVRVYQGEKLASNEWLLRYHRRGEMWLGAEAFFFQEGHGHFYEKAKYGELRVAPNGESVLIGLCDESRTPLKPKN